VDADEHDPLAGAESVPGPKERRVHWPDEPEADAVGDADVFAPGDAVLEDDAPADEYDLHPVPAPSGPVELPALELLAEPRLDLPELSPHELDAAADKLEETLRSFGVEGEVKDVRPGPVVTMFEFKPAPGVKINRIVNLSDDLALALRALSVRIVAPIPGKDAVGIEIPNTQREAVSLRDVLSSAAYQDSKSKLTLALGKNIAGVPTAAAPGSPRAGAPPERRPRNLVDFPRRAP